MFIAFRNRYKRAEDVLTTKVSQKLNHNIQMYSSVRKSVPFSENYLKTRL